MALVLNDRVKETTATTGTGTVTLAGAVSGFETFAVGIGNSNTTYYCIVLNAEFEVGLGTLSSDSSTLARTTILSSSNSDSAVDFSSGTKTVFCCLPASKATVLDASGNLILSGALEVDAGITVDNINIDGTEIDLSSGDLTLDVAGDIVLDAAGDEVIFKDGSTNVGHVSMDSDNLTIKSLVSDKDVLIQGNDGGSGITALTLDMSAAGAAAFNDNVTVGGKLIMPDVTSAKILVSDGTSYEEVAVSGDVSIASGGAVTIAGTSVETGMIAADAVTGAKIADDAIDSEHYTDGSIDNAHIADDAIDSEHYADGSIDNAHIADDAIDSEHYVDGSIDTAHLAADAVTGAKIADDAIDSEHYTDGSIDTAHIAADAITGAKIADDAIDSEHYTDGSIDNAHIADDAIDSEHYAAGSIDTAHLANDAVTGAKIADDAIDSEHYTDGSIDNAHIADDAIDSEHYADGSIDNAHIADDAIDSEHYAAASVDFAHIQNVAANSILGRDANSSGVLSEVALATTQVLIGDGTGFTAAALSGDVTMTNAGVVTIAGTSVETGMIAADAVTGAKIADDAIDSEHYTDGSIDNAHIADDAIDSEHYADGSIDNAHIADDAIDSEHYADGSIDTAHLSADCITSAKIADDAIDSEHYTDGSIDNAHIADDAIDSEHYAAGSIDTAHIADSQVTLAKTTGLVGKQTMWIPAAAMYPSTTNPCSDLEQVETTALRPDLKVLDFATGADEFAQFSIAFPKSWNEGTVTFQPFWTVTGTNTGTVAWQLGGIAVSSDDTINTAFGTLVATTALAHSGSSNDLMMSAESGAVTVAGSPAANDVCFFQINRDISADDQSGDARLLGIKLFFTNDALTDA
mgnify:FL=1